MPNWRDDKILELANQLSYSPAEKRREQLHAAINLLQAVEPDKAYPWDFVHFRITSFQPRSHIDHIVAGAILRADLATLIEFLSDTLSIKVEEGPAFGGDPSDSVLEVEDITRKFNVSSKTVQRWRKQGLIALRYVYPDGRRRLGFLDSAVSRFAADNKQRVERSAAFKQLSEEEKSAIIKLARGLLSGGGEVGGSAEGIKEISRRIAAQSSRAPETIRYTIRKHDRDHPEAALFPDVSETLRKMSHATSEDEPAADAEAGSLQALTQDRADSIKAMSIEYMPNPLFNHPDADNIILKVLPEQALAKAQATVTSGTNARAVDVYMARMPRDIPAFLQDIFRQPIMPQELETDAFRRMNYQKFKASQLQQTLNASTASPADFAEIETRLLQAGEIKNQILQGNLRVAVHVARKHQRIDRPLMELVSDATIWVMRAIEKYDFARPVRFSTYASYAIMKNFARDRAEQLTRRDERLVTGQEEVLNSLGSREEPHAAEQMDAANLQSDLLSVIDELPDRERELLTRHYGLDEARPALSLSELGDQMGITKVRVRQLEARALRKLRLLMESRRDKLRRAAQNPKLPKPGVP